MIGFEPEDRFELSGSAKHPNGMSFYQYLKEKQPEIYDLFGFNDDKKIKEQE